MPVVAIGKNSPCDPYHRRRVYRRLLVPYGDVILGPSEADLQAVVFRHELQKVRLEALLLAISQSIDLSIMNLLSNPKE